MKRVKTNNIAIIICVATFLIVNPFLAMAHSSKKASGAVKVQAISTDTISNILYSESEVNDPPRFIDGGELGMMKFIADSIKSPYEIEYPYEHRVIVSLIIEKDGSMSDMKVTSPPCHFLDKATLDVISKMPNWKPGLKDGFPVRVRYVIPLNFK